MKKFKKVAVGGTFDELHRGHKALLNKAFEVGEKVVIGLSSDEFVSKMGKPHKTATYSERFRELETFFEKSGFAKRAEIVPLNDPYGLTISGKGLDALVVSKETESTAKKINKVREQSRASFFKNCCCKYGSRRKLYAHFHNANKKRRNRPKRLLAKYCAVTVTVFLLLH